MTLLYSRGRSVGDNRPEQRAAATFDEFVAALDADRAPTKQNSGYLCGPLNGDGRRCADGALPRRWIAVDLDRIAADMLPDVRMWFSRFTGCGWPTHSSTQAEPRERALIELDRDATRDECILIGGMLAHDLGEEFGDALLVDASTFRPEQPVFLPPTGVDLARFDGDPLNVDRYLEAARELPTDAPERPTGAAHGAGKAAQGGRNATLSREAYRLRKQGLNVEQIAEVLIAMNAAMCNPPLGEDEVRSIARGKARVEPDPDDDERRQRQRKRAQDIGDGSAAVVPLTEIMSLADMLEQLAFISDGSRVARRDFPQTALPLPEFKLHTKASETRIAKKYIATADLWIQDPLRITAHTLTYRPGHPEFTSDPEGSPALNMWRERRRPASAASVEPFLLHIDYLVPIADERERFLDWLAHTEQFPGVLPHTHYLMVASQTGIGRNWLASLLARVWTGATRLGFDLVGTMQSGFNGALSRRLLVIVDELKAADTGYGSANHAQQLKAMLTTEHRSINPKFGRQHIEYNCARWLMLSQHYDALPLERNDRRVIVITNPQERKTPDYYAHLYGLLDDVQFVAAVGCWLGARDIRRFNPSEPAPLSAAKTKAIAACVSDVERALIELREGTDDYVMLASQITDYLADCGLARPHSRAMSAAYGAAGLVPCTKLVTLWGKKQRVVALRDCERLRDLPAAELQRLVNANAS